MSPESETSPSVWRACDWLLVGLGATVVVIDGILGIYYLGTVPYFLPVGAGSLRTWLAVLAVVILVLGGFAAGLRSPRYALVAVAGLPVVLVYSVTGLVLPWNQLSFWIAQSLLELVVWIPWSGRPSRSRCSAG